MSKEREMTEKQEAFVEKVTLFVKAGRALSEVWCDEMAPLSWGLLLPSSFDEWVEEFAAAFESSRARAAATTDSRPAEPQPDSPFSVRLEVPVSAGSTRLHFDRGGECSCGAQTYVCQACAVVHCDRAQPLVSVPRSGIREKAPFGNLCAEEAVKWKIEEELATYNVGLLTTEEFVEHVLRIARETA